MLLAAGAQAQSNSCDQFKDTLAARIDPSIRGFTLETVPASTPVPSGSKVIGTCEGGARKILFRREGSTRPAPSGASSAGPASAPQAVVVPVVPASTPSPTPQTVSRSAEARPAAPPTPSREAAKPLGARASEVAALPTVDRTIDRVVAQAEPVQPAQLVTAEAPPAQQTAESTATNWRWIWALVLLPLAAWLWLWHARRSAYDEAGLPRGPKL